MFSHALFLLAASLSSSHGSDSLPRRGILGVPVSPVPAETANQDGLKPGEGVLAGTPLPDGTAAAAGVQAGDVIVSLSGSAVTPPTIGSVVRDLKSGATVEISVVRAGKTLKLSTTLKEKPRDPGNANFSVEYSSVDTVAGRMRTILTHPKTPGKHPGILFIQGYSPISYDFDLDGKSGLDGPILTYFANSGMVLQRVEKPGVGDSEGGPFQDVDFTTETDIYRQALAQLRSQPDVDPQKIVIFGHSMGGAFGPVIGAETHVKGMIMYGIAARTWHEYLVDITRYQNLLSGSSYAQVDDMARQASRMFSMVMDEEMDPAQVATDHPELKQLIAESFPGGLFNAKTLAFWRQLEHTNFAALWAKVDCPVLAIHGASDFVTYDVDHQLVADIVNSVHPGWGTFLRIERSDHLLHDWATEAESLQHWPNGANSDTFMEAIKPWLAKLFGG